MSKFEQIEHGTVISPSGFLAGTAVANIKYKNRRDLALIVSERNCTAAAMFTQNQVVAAPVIIDKEVLAQTRRKIRAIVANAGNANACTGIQGIKNARATQRLVAAAIDCELGQVFVLSTGVIGIPLPMDKMDQGIAEAALNLNRKDGHLPAEAIMTTDTYPKQIAVTIKLPHGKVTIGGMAKGAGMIHPNMATMLAVVTTDAAIAPNVLDEMLQTAVAQSFNRISVDGDTSTNDTILCLANGVSGTAVADPDSQAIFQDALNYVCTHLAQLIVRDGEGATKYVEIQVTGTATDADAHAIANTIATSPLVKTAFAGSDPNWGRILAAAGRANIVFDQYQTDLFISKMDDNELQLVAGGTPTQYLEVDAANIFAQPEFKIHLRVGDGIGSAIVWTTDLSHDYITINADYRT